MKKLILPLFFLAVISGLNAQEKAIDKDNIKADVEKIINDISANYVYLTEKKIDLNCIRDHYTKQVENIKTEEETVLLFEYLLDEFYDNHLTLRTNRSSSYRLFAPIYASTENGKAVVTNVWQTQVENLDQNILGAEILAFNGTAFSQAIENFPTHCQDKNDPETKEWIANKVLAGRYNEPRLLTLRLADQTVIELDLDAIKLKNDANLLSHKVIDGIGIIRINNSLGNDNLVTEFDKALHEAVDTKGLIIDLRNTIFGGDSYEARGIMSRFIDKAAPYQRHSYIATSQNNPDVERSWVEYVSPRAETYRKPVVVLVGRWTGSMGEGMAIGFEGMGRAEVVGTEMRRLAGEVYDFNFQHQWYGYKLSTAKLFHINGTIREKYIPTHYVRQSTIEKDELLEAGMKLIRQAID